jgi:hypothetical protein
MMRVNLGFDERDPDQAEAYMLLKTYKNKKAAYLTKLILADVERRNKENAITEEDLRRILREELASLDLSNVSVKKDSENVKEKSSKKTEKKKESKKAKEEPAEKEPESLDVSSSDNADEDIIKNIFASMPGM